MLEAKAFKVLQNPGAQKQKNTVTVMANVQWSTKGPSPYNALKYSPSSPPKFFQRNGARQLAQPLGFN